MQPGLASLRPSALLDGQILRIPDQPLSYLNDLRLRNGQPDRRRQPGGEQLIGQHPDMLRVIAEFDHVQIAIRCQHEVALRAAPHASNLLDRDHCHGSHLGCK